jgi:hypothetical protein
MRYISIVFVVITLLSCREDCVKSERCELVPDSGPCFASMPRYYYDKEEKRCKEFTWGGCEGVVPFETLEECKQCECK